MNVFEIDLYEMQLKFLVTHKDNLLKKRNNFRQYLHFKNQSTQEKRRLIEITQTCIRHILNIDSSIQDKTNYAISMYISQLNTICTEEENSLNAEGIALENFLEDELFALEHHINELSEIIIKIKSLYQVE